MKNQKTLSTKTNVNLNSLKNELKKNEKNFTKESKSNSNKNLYKGIESLSNEDQKKFRSKIRRKLDRFVSDILGKDRSDQERINSINEFLEFYKKNWIINDFELSNFTSTNKEDKRKDFKIILDICKNAISN